MTQEKTNEFETIERERKVKIDSLKTIIRNLWDRKYFVVGYYEAGIKLYKIWDIRNINQARKIKEHIDLRDLREFYMELK